MFRGSHYFRGIMAGRRTRILASITRHAGRHLSHELSYRVTLAGFGARFHGMGWWQRRLADSADRPGDGREGNAMVLQPDEAGRATSVDEAGRKKQVRLAAMASVIGTSIEWYDFFLYGTAA